MTNPTPEDACPAAGSVCKYTHPVDAHEAAVLFLIVEAHPDAMPPRVRIRPLFWPWPIVPEETVSPDDVTALTPLEITNSNPTQGDHA